MISLLVTLLILALIAGLIWYVISLIPLPPPFGMVLRVVVVVVFVIILIWYLLPLAGVPAYR